MVTWAHWPAMLGTMVAAVAPEPMMTTRLSVMSRSSGQCMEWKRRPLKASAPGQSGV